MTASGGANKNVAYFTGTNTLGSSTDLQFDTTNSTLTVRDQMLVAGSGAGYFMDERDGSGQWVMYATAARGGSTTTVQAIRSRLRPAINY